MGDCTRQLRGDGNEKGDGVFVKPLFGMVLYDQHPEHLAVMNDRHTQVSVIVLFAGLGEIPVTCMIGRIVQIERLGAFRDQDTTRREFLAAIGNPTSGSGHLD